MKAKKNLGQNWLIDETVINDIIENCDLNEDSLVIEIGPGQGILTKALLKTGAKVIAIEKDRDLHEILQTEFASYEEKFELIAADVRDLDLEELAGGEPYQVIANIPYYITGLIIRLFLTTKTQPTAMTLLVQREVADRITSVDNKESVLSLSVKAYGTPIKLRNVKAGAFRPIPSVDSAVIQITNINRDYFNNNDLDETRFFGVIKQAFNQKRKTIRSTLGSEPYRIDFNSQEDLKTLSNRRPETINLSEWMFLIKNLTDN